MKKTIALAMALLLLIACIPVSAEEADGLTEARCD